MTPKEKALKLCQDMAYTSMKADFNEGYTLPLEIAKKCAIVAVGEIIKARSINPDYLHYWQEVKTEIEKL